MIIIKIPHESSTDTAIAFGTISFSDSIKTMSEHLSDTNAYFQNFDNFNDFCSWMIEEDHAIECFLENVTPQHRFFSVELDDSGRLSCQSHVGSDELDKAEKGYWLEKMAENNQSSYRSEILFWECELDAREAGEAMEDSVVKTTLLSMVNSPYRLKYENYD